MDERLISQLPPLSVAEFNDFVPVSRAGASGQLTLRQILDLILGAPPGALDTLDELAAALGDDPNFATTVMAAIGARALLLHSGTSDDTFSDGDELAYVSGTTQKRGTVSGLKENLVASILTWTAKQTFRNAEFTTNPLDLSAGRIKFPATQVSSTDANTLDDYEEGVWTPIITQGVVPSTSTKVGTYTKIGRLVTLNMLAVFSGAGTPSNLIEVTGLPFPPSGQEFLVTGSGYFFDTGSQFYGLAVALSASAGLRFYSHAGGGNFGAAPVLTIASGDRLSFSISYEV